MSLIPTPPSPRTPDPKPEIQSPTRSISDRASEAVARLLFFSLLLVMMLCIGALAVHAMAPHFLPRPAAIILAVLIAVYFGYQTLRCDVTLLDITPSILFGILACAILLPVVDRVRLNNGLPTALPADSLRPPSRTTPNPGAGKPG